MENNNEWNATNDTAASITEILFEYVRYWKWFVLSVLLCLIIGVLIILVTQKQYKSSISILLNENKNSGRSSGSNLSDLDLSAIGLMATTNNIDNEVAVLSSPDLMRSVVDTLNLQSTYYITKRLRKVELYNASPLFVSVEAPNKTDVGGIRFDIQKKGPEYVLHGIYKGLNNNTLQLNEKIHSLPVNIKLGNTMYLHIQLTGREMVEGETYHVTVSNIFSTVSSLINNLSVDPTTKTSSVLNLDLLTHNTEKGAAILRELVRQYNSLNVYIKNEIARNTAAFIQDRIKEISVELGSAEDKVVSYKQQNQIVDLGAQAQLFVQQTGANSQQLRDIETQLNVISYVERFVDDPANKYEVIPNIGITDAGLTQIINEYNNQLLNMKVVLKGMGADNPSRIKLMADIDNKLSNISKSLKNVKQTYNVTKQDILKQWYSTQSQILSAPQQERGLVGKERDQKIKEDLFLFLMQKREETNLSIASTSDKARIIASPQEKNIPPIAPKSQMILLTVLLLGLLIPVVVLYVINMVNTQIQTRNELEKLSEVPIIGQISHNENKNHIVIQPETNSSIAEMFRSLRNNLNFIFKQRVNQIIMVTSTIKGEGKTFISLNLATSFALPGKKVLLVGADIRNPQLSKYIGLKGKKGLSDYLASRDSWKDYVLDIEWSNNFQVMIAGTIPPNPNELLMDHRLKEFLKEASQEYDFVIIDSAPVGLVSDTYLIDEFVDVTLYIVRENVTPKTAINFINTQKNEGKLTNMYLVLNDSYINNSYKYGYGKNYGYRSKE